MKIRHDIAGGLAGFAMGLTDLALFRLLNLNITLNQHDAMIPVVLFFALTFAALGFLAGRLYDTHKREKEHAKTIQNQLTDLASSQRALIQQEKLASLGRMAAGIAHEVRNPLSVIRSSAELLLEDMESQQQRDNARACTFIIKEIDRLNHLITALLAFARPTRQENRSFPPQILLQKITTHYQRMLKTLNLTLTTQWPDNLPDLHGDPALLTQVLMTLIDNAIMQTAGTTGTIELRARKTPLNIEIEVTDTGKGVPEDILEMIFEPFFTTRIEGTGLGLAIARRIAEEHLGTLDVVPHTDANNASGACFRLTLPQKQEDKA